MDTVTTIKCQWVGKSSYICVLYIIIITLLFHCCTALVWNKTGTCMTAVVNTICDGETGKVSVNVSIYPIIDDMDNLCSGAAPPMTVPRDLSFDLGLDTDSCKGGFDTRYNGELKTKEVVSGLGLSSVMTNGSETYCFQVHGFVTCSNEDYSGWSEITCYNESISFQATKGGCSSINTSISSSGGRLWTGKQQNDCGCDWFLILASTTTISLFVGFLASFTSWL